MRPAGPFVLNRWVAVQDSGLAATVAAPPIESFGIEERPPAEPEMIQAIGDFERAAPALKKANRQISYVVPALLRMPAEQAAQVITITNSPGRVIPLVAPPGPSFEYASFDARPGANLRARFFNGRRLTHALRNGRTRSRDSESKNVFRCED